MKVGGRLLPSLTNVEPLDADDPRIQKIWPGIAHVQESNQLAVIFPGIKQPVIIHRDQILEVDE